MNLKTLVKSMMLTAAVSLPATAAQLEISVTNLTHGNHFTPILVAAHGADTSLFKAGEKASPELQKMAEGGAIDDLVTLVEGANGVTVKNPANGLLAPSAKTDKFSFDTGDRKYLSVVAMILPTNDAFIGLSNWKIPTEKGTYTLNLNGYDAGTEDNNELLTPESGAPGVLGIPAAPGKDAGTGGTGVVDGASNDKVHIHPGVLGDTDKSGGMSDLDSRVHRWLNPVARVVVTVK
ncbi:spondin domain-containing protein [Parashewanella tropica]|uniref:spondin domain-containing protein n=1 Tax=Parashewanella tropica TaxID=2547970 RepID=UPI001059784D|nr:spondin domain-containing protein [Parashewanella tropica]